MYFFRNIENDIKDQLEARSNRIILLSGARQTGKTTILENIDTSKKKLMINFWDETREVKVLRNAGTFEQFTEYLRTLFGFKPDGSRILVIDEAQASVTLGRFLMQMHREWKDQKVVLLGSILSNLVKDDTPMPTGRVVEMVCRPLSFSEFLRFCGKESYLDLLDRDAVAGGTIDNELHVLLMGEYERYLRVGGLPGMVNAMVAGEDLSVLFETLLNNVYRDADRFIAIDSDITRSRVVQYGSLVEHCLKTIAQHVSFPTVNSTIVSTDSPSYRKILPRVLEALRSWHLVYFVQNETRQQTTKKGYSSKKYLFDTGVMNYLVNHLMPVSLAEPGELHAQLLENAVLQELVSTCGSIRRVSSFKTNNKSRTELDFAARVGDRVIPVEVKSGKKVNTKSINQLLEYMRYSNLKRGYVIYAGKPMSRKIEGLRISFIPPYYLPIILLG